MLVERGDIGSGTSARSSRLKKVTGTDPTRRGGAHAAVLHDQRQVLKHHTELPNYDFDRRDIIRSYRMA